MTKDKDYLLNISLTGEISFYVKESYINDDMELDVRYVTYKDELIDYVKEPAKLVRDVISDVITHVKMYKPYMLTFKGNTKRKVRFYNFLIKYYEKELSEYNVCNYDDGVYLFRKTI